MLSGFELYPRWVPLVVARLQREAAEFHVLSRTRTKDNFLFLFLNFDAGL